MTDQTKKKRICRVCKNVFTTNTSARACPQCRGKYYIKTCTTCGKEFKTWFPPQRRCLECCKKEKLLTKNCALCGEEFQTNNYHKKYCSKCGGGAVAKQYRQEVSYNYGGTVKTIRLSVPEVVACRLYVNGKRLGEISQRTALSPRHLQKLFEDKIIPGVREYMTAIAEGEITKLTVEVQRIITTVITEMNNEFLGGKKTKKDLYDWVRLAMEWLSKMGVIKEQPPPPVMTDEEIINLAKQTKQEIGIDDNNNGDNGDNGNNNDNEDNENNEDGIF